MLLSRPYLECSSRSLTRISSSRSAVSALTSWSSLSASFRMAWVPRTAPTATPVANTVVTAKKKAPDPRPVGCRLLAVIGSRRISYRCSTSRCSETETYRSPDVTGPLFQWRHTARGGCFCVLSTTCRNVNLAPIETMFIKKTLREMANSPANLHK